MQLTTIKESNLSTWATDINHHHEQASLHAGKAIDHAIEAGKLLLRVKARLPHGEFGKWVDANVAVTQRQVQRYIGAAEGRPVPMRALASNTTPVSLLPEPDWLPTDPNVLATLVFSRPVACPSDDGGKPEMVHPRLLVQRMGKDSKHWQFEEDRPMYFAAFIEGNSVEYTTRPQPGWMVAYSMGMFAGGRIAKSQKMVQALALQFEDDAALHAHADLGWEYSEAPQFVSILVDVVHPFNPMEH